MSHPPSPPHYIASSFLNVRSDILIEALYTESPVLYPIILLFAWSMQGIRNSDWNMESDIQTDRDLTEY